MPGIFGFLHPAPSEQTRRQLDAMTGALRDEPVYQSYQHTEEGISMGRVGLPIVQPQPQPAWNEARTVAVVMEGEIYEYASHRAALEQCGHQFASASQPELLAHLYEEKGLDFAASLRGVFAAAVWDREKKQLALVTDHLALQPLFYTAGGAEGFAFGSGVRAVLASPALSRKLDMLAVAQFLTFDHVLQNRTLLEGVRQLSYGSMLVVRDGEARLHRYWTPKYPEYYPIRDENEYLEELIPALRLAFARQVPGDLSAAILLSGGLDSRVVAAMLRDAAPNTRIKTFTFGQPDSTDEKYSKEVAAKLGMPHQFYTVPGDYLLNYANKGVRISDGMANIVHMHTLPNLSDQARQAQVMYKGFLGDTISGYTFTPRILAHYAEDDMPYMHLSLLQELNMLPFLPDQVDRALLPDAGEPFSQQVVESVRQVIGETQTRLLADQRNFFDIFHRASRMTITGVEWVRSQAHVRLPLADRDLVQFMLSVPPGLRYQRRIMKDAFIRLYPELAKIPITKTNYPMVHCRREITMRLQEQIQWWLRARGMKFIPMPVKRSYVLYSEWMRTTLRPWMEEILLSKTTRERGLFDPAFVKSLVDEQLAGKKHHSRLGALMAIELWHRQFID